MEMEHFHSEKEWMIEKALWEFPEWPNAETEVIFQDQKPVDLKVILVDGILKKDSGLRLMNFFADDYSSHQRERVSKEFIDNFNSQRRL